MSTEDSFVHAVVNWITPGCYTGFGKSEWCSDHHVSFATINDPNWGHHLTALPVIASHLDSLSDLVVACTT